MARSPRWPLPEQTQDIDGYMSSYIEGMNSGLQAMGHHRRHQTQDIDGYMSSYIEGMNRGLQAMARRDWQ